MKLYCNFIYQANASDGIKQSIIMGKILRLNICHASDDYLRLLVTLANSLNVGLDLDPNRMTL